MFLPRKILEERLRKMLTEDTGEGDVTTALIVSAENAAEAEVIAKDPGVVAGIEEGKVLLESLGLKVEALVADGEKIKKRQILMKIFGDARTILSVERTFLNILSRMSGVATKTRQLIDELQKVGLKTIVACTRKTTPGFLYFDKRAVSIGGGDTHRLHLDDMILIKDNHIKAAGSIEETVKRVKEKASFSKKIEVEVTTARDVLAAARAGVDIIMFDNFSRKQIDIAIKLLKKVGLRRKILLEASGGITAENIIPFASTGVDIVSLGEITDSPKSLDISLEITRIKKK